MNSLQSMIKHNPLSVAAATSYLRYRCRTVRAYIFVATTGRSGSESLSRIFETIEGSACFHEPWPIMFNDAPPHVESDTYFASRFRTVKQVNIRRLAAGHRYYVETNHQFVKKFCSVAVRQFGRKIRIIHLVRNPVSVATSFYALQSIPGETQNGRIYLLDPRDDTNRVGMADVLYGDSEFGHDFFKCLWYWYEVEARIKELKARHPEVRWAGIGTDELNDPAALESLFRRLGLEADPEKLRTVAGTHLNRKRDKKLKPRDREQFEEMHQQLRRRMEKRFGPGFWY